MAKIIGFTYGELRGKIGGTVFSRNKAGAYARARVTPVNPQTVRQQSARYDFGNASIMFQNLSAELKNCWEDFAKTHFNPLKGNNTGIYSAGNAYVALRQSTVQGNKYRTDFTAVSGADAMTITQVPYPNLIEPPTAPSSTTIQVSGGAGLPFELNNIAVDNGGRVQVDLAFPTAEPSDARTFTEFINLEGQRFGLGFYISNSLKFVGAKPNTALKLNFSDSGLVTNIDKTTGTGGAVVGSGLAMLFNSTLVPADVRDFPCVGDHCLVTPFLRSESGAQKLLPPQYVTVVAPF